MVGVVMQNRFQVLHYHSQKVVTMRESGKLAEQIERIKANRANKIEQIVQIESHKIQIEQITKRIESL